MTTDQPRTSGGLYGEFPRSANDHVDLSATGDGTYEFPPLLRTADEAIRFWTVVEVPEIVLVNMRSNWALHGHADANKLIYPPPHAWRMLARATGMWETATLSSQMDGMLPPHEQQQLLAKTIEIPGLPAMTLEELRRKGYLQPGWASDIGRENAAGERVRKTINGI